MIQLVHLLLCHTQVESLFKYILHAVLGYTPSIIPYINFCTVMNVFKDLVSLRNETFLSVFLLTQKHFID
jgi:hypothetical protein